MISEGLCMKLHGGLRSSERLERLRTRVAVETDSGRVVLRLQRVLSRSRQLEGRRGFVPFALAVASLSCQTSTCLTLKKILLRDVVNSSAGEIPCRFAQALALLSPSGGARMPRPHRRRGHSCVTAELLRDRPRKLASGLPFLKHLLRVV